MTHSKPERITPYDLVHLPLEIELIETFRQRNRALPKEACFDTAFHRTLPGVATLLPISRRRQAFAATISTDCHMNSSWMNLSNSMIRRQPIAA
jgi:hypothetical protein